MTLVVCCGWAAGAALAAEPIATTDGDLPDVRLDVTELARTSGDTLTLKFRIVNQSDEPVDFLYEFGDPEASVPDRGSVGGAYLIDAANKKKYLVLRDSNLYCVCSRDVPTIAPGAQAPLWAKFPAPPEDVDAITVVVPHFIPMDDVPISG